LKRRSELALVLIGVALCVAGFAGCGSDAETAPASTKGDAKFVAAADKVCARGRLRGLRFQPPKDGQSERKALAQGIDENLLPSLQRVIDGVRALDIPPGSAAETEAFLAAMRQGVEKAEALDVPTMERVEALLAPSGKLARQAGLEACIYG